MVCERYWLNPNPQELMNEPVWGEGGSIKAKASATSGRTSPRLAVIQLSTQNIFQKC